MKTQIIVVDTCLESYSERGLRAHSHSLRNSCKGRRVGMILSEKEFYESQSSPYWIHIHENVLDFSSGIIDFNKYEDIANSLEQKALRAPSLLSRRHLEAQSHFMQLAGDVGALRNDILDKDFEVIVTDFPKGFFLQQIYPYDFSLSFEGIGSYVDHEDAYARLEEFKILRRISPFSESYIDGTWDIENPKKGNFEIHFVDEPRIGYTQGLIVDTRGIARFQGEIKRNSFNFKKNYFLDSVLKDQERPDRLITKAPINYALYAGFTEGHFWWGKNEKNCRYCSCEVRQKIGYR